LVSGNYTGYHWAADDMYGFTGCDKEFLHFREARDFQ